MKFANNINEKNMAAHKGQHIIPACYLRGFLAKEAPDEHLHLENYEIGVYTNNKTLSDKWRMKGVNHKIFKKNWFYNISQAEDALHVEKGLSAIEGKYASILRKLNGLNILSRSDKQDLSRFTVAMLIRTESFQANFQGSINKMVGFHNELTGDSDFHKEYVDGHEDISKRLVIENGLQDFLTRNGLSIIINRTWLPFVTCDNPVLRRDTHSDEIAMLVGQGPHCRSEFTPSQTKPFFYMPVTAEMALVSCELIDHLAEENQYIECVDADVVLKLNYFLIAQAENYIVSDRKLPFGEIEGNFSAGLANKKPENGISAKIYTTKNRYVFKVLSIEDIPDGVCLRLLDLDIYKKIVFDGDVVSLEIYKDGRNTRGMRQIEIGGADDKFLEIKIVSRIRLGVT